MSYESTCFHCTKDQRLQDLMIEIAELPQSTLYLFKEQTYRGRCLLSFKGHKGGLTELEPKEFTQYMQDLAQAAKAVQKVFNPQKINYGAYSDTLAHLHFHIVPKYENGYSWGSTFEMMPENKMWLSETQYSQLVESIRANL
ncbi:HIT family protein [Propionispora vibrioides]|jgi:ATP adenylyltransferase|uniref:Diadenosine tetraphosphate (Ap4A) hydrolase n=1 Tax=Propionispora vibrioides TaxID=112903 RepID=A0A1H8R5I2_9FIRM|nr:HIT domain-containing protein [Propionispora vibrioides]SEO61374.1 Diadenosine tetraphosphate (Ap4A) hydrolase [Propionispora vibrioides]